MSRLIIISLFLLACSTSSDGNENNGLFADITSIQINRDRLSGSHHNLETLTLEFIINEINSTNVTAENLVSVKWSSPTFPFSRTTNFKQISLNTYTLVFPEGNHILELEITTDDNVYTDQINLNIHEFNEFTITHDDALWTNYNFLIDQVRHIIVDTNDNKWFGTFGFGVIKYDNQNFSTHNDYDYNKDPDAIRQSFAIQSMTYDPQTNTVWSGHFFDSFINKISDDTIISFIVDTVTTPNNDIHSILVDGDDLWIGMHFNSFAKFNTITKEFTQIQVLPLQNQINDLAYDSNNDIWGVGTFNYAFEYDQVTWNQQFTGRFYTAVHVESNSNIWFGSNSGLMQFDGVTQTYFLLNNSGIPSDAIRDIDSDLNGNIWIATDNGIAKYDGQDWTLFNSATSPIVNEDVRAIAIDKRNQVWIGTSSGISVYKGDML